MELDTQPPERVGEYIPDGFVQVVIRVYLKIIYPAL